MLTVSIIIVVLVGAASAWLGLRYGLVAAGLAIGSQEVLEKLPHLQSSGFPPPETYLFGSFFAALLVGLYVEAARPKWVAAYATLGARGHSVPPHSDSLLRKVFRFIGVLASAQFSKFLLGEMLRPVAAAAIALCGLAVALFASNVLNVRDSSGIGLVFILAAAVFLGARAALVSTTLTVLGMNYLPIGGQFPFHLNSAVDLFVVTLFSVTAWAFGSYGDRTRRERRIGQVFLKSSGRLFSADDEISIRHILYDALASVTEVSAVWVIDECGASIVDDGPPIPKSVIAALADITAGNAVKAGPWRVRPLNIGNFPIGAIAWPAAAGNTNNTSIVDQAVTSLCDLAGAAIARVRLAAEKSEAEFLARTERLRGALLASLSHDFRTPLSGILGSATSLLDLGDQYDHARRHDLLQNIKEQTFRLNRYIENLLSMTRFESGALQINPVPVFIEPLIYDAWDVLNDFGGAARLLKVRFDIEAAIAADPVLFHQVLVNVFENAIKYSPEGSTVHVRGQRAGNRQRLEIWDEGAGVKPNEARMLFDRFFRGRGSSKPGAGLGLHIVKSIVEAMGGTVEAYSGRDGQSGLCVAMTLVAADLEE